ncbi:anti-sigma regulatory factor (Ser/Thr protein kinase) [Saccharomonospora amisosensis]|uniref:Anti-sigma regulatory factor (Ser/Thr protein kinase) n=1 Tax=Saccharomonospora amisosensis TaxID=1128677 RepID=A0A7X5ZQ57_9PSEU|nr:anti-sigma factor RsbA family regulatory protein [Saccharomonospora amisosensis]NIJ10990.1 anti-sigma regulatory factor (Ser/Thr protein kinase) [Saccharomonospora amisosensis]
MRSGIAEHHEGYLHEAAYYGSDDEFLSITIPFVEEGLRAGEPTVVALGEDGTRLLKDAFGSASGLAFRPGDDSYSRPASAIKEFHELVRSHVFAGAEQVRVVGEIPHLGTGVVWDPWARYEAAVNHVLAGFPLWGLCMYDSRVTPAGVLADVERTHPMLATPGGGHVKNAGYVDPATFLSDYEPRYADPLEQSVPAVELLSPTPEAARKATAAAGRDSGLTSEEVDGLVMAVSELVTNGLRHGEPPVELRLWSTRGRMVATVSDRGDGPKDPFVGLVPARQNPAEGGLGLWIAHQVCEQVTMHRTETGFTARLVAGARATQPAPQPPAYRH